MRSRPQPSYAAPALAVAALFVVSSASAAYAATAAKKRPPTRVTIDELLGCPSIERGKCPPMRSARENSRETTAAAAIAWLGDHSDATDDKISRLSAVIGELGTAKQCEELVAVAQKRAESKAHIDLLMAGARLLCKEVSAPLIKRLKAATSQREAVLAAGALGVLGAKDSTATLIPHLESKWPRMQAAAAQALGTVGDPSAIRPLMKLAGRPSTYTPARLQALRALARLKAVDALPLAMALIESTPRTIGIAALSIIEASPLPWTRPVIAQALRIEGLRGAAARAAMASPHDELGVLCRDAAALETLAESERLAVLLAVGALRPSGAAAVLMTRLEKAKPAELIAIMKVLPKLGDRTVIPGLVNYLPHAEPEVAKFVVYALENVTGKRIGLDIPAWRSLAGLEPDPTALTPKK